MKIIRNTKPISDLYTGMKSGDIVVNREYQRSSGLWPSNSRTYFIDTILNDFPFPKVVLWQKIDIKTKKTKTEIIDGQQRLTTIRDFIDNKLRLSTVSKRFSGKTFAELTEDEQQAFLSYEVSLDSIISGTREEILEIFKRINSYTLALNKAEQRFATYQGEFKWFVNDLTEIISPYLNAYNVMSERDFSRMQDDDLIAECCLQYLSGIMSRSSAKLDELYRKYDIDFPQKPQIKEVIETSFNFIKDNLTSIFEECNIKSYNFYSLMGAVMFNKYGFFNIRNIDGLEPQNIFCNNPESISERLNRIFSAVDNKDIDSEYANMVRASDSSTHALKNRKIRFEVLLKALQE